MAIGSFLESDFDPTTVNNDGDSLLHLSIISNLSFLSLLPVENATILENHLSADIIYIRKFSMFISKSLSCYVFSSQQRAAFVSLVSSGYPAIACLVQLF